MAAIRGLDFGPAQEIDEYQQAIDCFAIIRERQDDVLDLLEALVWADIRRLGAQWLARFDDPAAVMPDLVGCPLMVYFRKPGARIVFEKIFRHVRSDQTISEIHFRFASDIQYHGMQHKPGDICRVDIRSSRQATVFYLSAPV